MACYSPLKGFENRDDGGIQFKRTKNAGPAIEVACGQCLGCRIDKSKEWAARIVHESQMHQANCFITLTYNAENLPTDGSLNKEHFQKFIKRLRKAYEPKKLRYFHCGEYGDQMDRPHYHACLFGINFDDDRVQHSANHRDDIIYTSAKLEKLWGKGFTTIGELNYETAAYTARYIMKKITGQRAEQHYEKLNEYTGEVTQLQPEYVTMSLGRYKGEGIGGKFYEKYKTDFFPSDECPVPGRGVYKKVPRYYENLYKADNPEEFNTIKRKRENYKNSHMAEYTAKRLETKYKVKKAQLAHLKRT